MSAVMFGSLANFIGLVKAWIRPSCVISGWPLALDDRPAVRAEHVEVDVLVQHRMAEAVDDVGEFRADRRIDVDVDAAGKMDGRRDVTCEFVEDDVLVLGFGAQLGGLEQALAVPLIVAIAVPGVRTTPGNTQSAGEGNVAGVEVLLDRRLDLRQQAVVFGMEQLLDGGQADVLVHPAVTGDVVSVQQLVVVGRVGARLRIEWLAFPASVSASAASCAGSSERCRRCAPCRRGRCCRRRLPRIPARDGAVGGRPGRRDCPRSGLASRRACSVGEIDDELRQAMRAGDEIAVGVGRQQRHGAHVGSR